MKTFVLVIQISSYQFDVFKFDAESQSRVYPKSRSKGITIAIFESNKTDRKSVV